MLSETEYEKLKLQWNDLNNIRVGDPQEKEFDRLTDAISNHEKSISSPAIPDDVEVAFKQYK